METVIVALIVGAFSGLLGSIAGPFLTHRLDQRRRRQIREEERQEELRQMVEEAMRFCRRTLAASIWVQRASTLGISHIDAYERFLADTHAETPSTFVWRPHRITDDWLRELASELVSQNNQFRGLMASPPEAQEALDKAGDIEALLDKVDLRLDGLGW